MAEIFSRPVRAGLEFSEEPPPRGGRFEGTVAEPSFEWKTLLTALRTEFFPRTVVPTDLAFMVKVVAPASTGQELFTAFRARRTTSTVSGDFSRIRIPAARPWLQ